MSNQIKGRLLEDLKAALFKDRTKVDAVPFLVSAAIYTQRVKLQMLLTNGQELIIVTVPCPNIVYQSLVVHVNSWLEQKKLRLDG